MAKLERILIIGRHFIVKNEMQEVTDSSFLLKYFGGQNTKLFLETPSEVTQTVKTRQHGSLRSIVFATAQHGHGLGQLYFADVLIGTDTSERLHLAIESGVAHGHLVGHEPHVDVFGRQILIDNPV